VKSVKHFHHYLYGRHFKVRTDHGSLTWLLNFKNPEGQLARWFELLSSYDFTIEHRAGLSHSNADALSRRPCADGDCKHCTRAESKYGSSEVKDISNECVGTKLESCQVVTHSGNHGNTLTSNSQNSNRQLTFKDKSLREIQESDPNIKKVIEWVTSQDKPSWENTSNLSEVCKYCVKDISRKLSIL
jgi:hypothetical protein